MKRDSLAVESTKQDFAYPYYFSRFLERADNITRIISYTLAIGAEEDRENTDENPAVYATMLHALDRFEEFCEEYETPDRDSVFRFLALDSENPISILNCLGAAASYSTHPRSKIPTEAKNYLKGFLDTFSARRDSYVDLSEMEYLLHLVHSSAQMIFGMVESTMIRGRQYSFQRLGLNIERADNTSRLIDAKRFSPIPEPGPRAEQANDLQWRALLHQTAAGDYLPFQKSDPTEETILYALILDGRFPRSLRHCVSEADETLRKVAGIRDHQFSNPPTRFLGRLRSEMDYSDLKEILSYGLAEYISNFQSRLHALHETINDSYFEAN